MKMVVWSGVAIRLCRDKVQLFGLSRRSFSEGGRITTSNAPFSDRNKVFQAFLKTFEITSSITLHVFWLFPLNRLFRQLWNELEHRHQHLLCHNSGNMFWNSEIFSKHHNWEIGKIYYENASSAIFQNKWQKIQFLYEFCSDGQN